MPQSAIGTMLLDPALGSFCLKGSVSFLASQNGQLFVMPCCFAFKKSPKPTITSYKLNFYVLCHCIGGSFDICFLHSCHMNVGVFVHSSQHHLNLLVLLALYVFFGQLFHSG